MRAIAANVVTRRGLCVCLRDTPACLAKWLKQIDMPSVVQTGVNLRNRALDGSAHWRHLANTIERCGLVSNCVDHLLIYGGRL